MNTLSNVESHQGDRMPFCIDELRINAFPEIKCDNGVSVRYVRSADKQWFALRATYGREDAAAQCLLNHGVYTYIAKRHVKRRVGDKTLVIPEHEMENFVLATRSHNEHILLVAPGRCHYRSGDRVRVTEGVFNGVEGRVARVAGQQRVVIQLSGIGLVTTAYVPTAFLEPVKDE